MASYGLLTVADGEGATPLVNLGAGKLIYIGSRCKCPGDRALIANDDKFATCTENGKVPTHGIFRSGKIDPNENAKHFSKVTAPTLCGEENSTIDTMAR